MQENVGVIGCMHTIISHGHNLFVGILTFFLNRIFFKQQLPLVGVILQFTKLVTKVCVISFYRN